ncbi:MAG: FKBP-type peptidyl-prolyl cis-trans isomerase [Thiolinea sp.]
MSLTIQNHSRIRWRYRLLLANGELFEESKDEQGEILQLGQDEIHPNLESLLYGLSQGETTRFLVSAEQAFGYRDPQAIQQLPLSSFTEPPELKQIISFTLPSGQEAPGHILEIDQAQGLVSVDFNHPLAGHNIVLEVEILEVIS